MRKFEEMLQKRANAKRFKSDTSKLIKSLKNLIKKHTELTTIDQSLRQVYFHKKNIDNQFLQLVGSTRHYFMFNILF